MHWKLLGAGGGGFFLLCEKKKQSEFKNFFKKFIFTDFEFDNLGSQILYNDEKKSNFKQSILHFFCNKFTIF